MPTQKFSSEVLTAAIVGFEAQKIRIDAQIAELRQMLAGGRTETAAPSDTPKRKRRRKLSAAVRKRIGEAQRKRWAESKGQSEPLPQAVTSEAPKAKRKLSAAGRKRIIEANQRRWAAAKAAKKAAPKKAVSKKVATKAPVKAAKKTVAKKPRKTAAKAPEQAVPTVSAQ